MKQATLSYVIQNDKVLLIKKKRGIGKDFYNGPGGKIEDGETPRKSVIRETKEEVGINLHSLEKVGELKFIFGKKPFMYVHIFKTNEFEGKPKETEEAKPVWFFKNDLPYDKMWPDDKYWMPLMFEDKKFKGMFNFDESGDELINHKLNTVKSF